MATVMKLYETVDALDTVLEWLEENETTIRENGGVIPEELDELLEQVEGDFEEKVKRVALMVQNLKASASVAKSEADRLKAAAKSYENQADALSNYLHAQLNRAGVPRVETPVVKVRVQRASRPSIQPTGEIPDDLKRVTVELDGTAAYDRLKPLLGKDAPDTGEVDGLRWDYSYGVRVW